MSGQDKDPYDFDDDGSVFAEDADWGVSTRKNDQLLKLKAKNNAWQSRGQFCITAGGEVIAKQRQAAKLRESSSVGYQIVRLSKGKLPAVCVGEPEFDANDPIASIRQLMKGLRNWYAGLQGAQRQDMEKLAQELEGEFLPGESGSIGSITVMPEKGRELTPEQQAAALARRADLEKLSTASTYKVVKGNVEIPRKRKT